MSQIFRVCEHRAALAAIQFFRFPGRPLTAYDSAGTQQRHGGALLLTQAVDIEIQRRPSRAVPKQRADRFDIHTQFEQARGKRVPQGVEVCAGKTQSFRQPGKTTLDGSRVSSA